MYYPSSVRLLLSGPARKNHKMRPVSGPLAARKRPVRVQTWPVRVNTVVPLRATYGIGLRGVAILLFSEAPCISRIEKKLSNFAKNFPTYTRVYTVILIGYYN